MVDGHYPENGFTTETGNPEQYTTDVAEQGGAITEMDMLRAENERLHLELENANMRATLNAMNNGTPSSGVEGLQVGPPPPKAPGGAPVPRAPIAAPLPDAHIHTGAPKAGDLVRVTCRSGANIRATGQKCTHHTQKIQGIVPREGGGRRVIYVCELCKQPWNVST